MKRIKGIAALVLAICLFATMLPLPFITAAAEENSETVLTGIDIVVLPRKTEYWVGEALSTEGMVLLASYTDGSMVEITEGFSVSGFQSAVAGEQILTATYQGATDTFTVTVKQREVIGIEIVSPPAKTKYYTWEALDTTGLVLRVSYLGGTISQITEGFAVTWFNSALAGQQTVTVMYGEAAAEFTVTVEERFL